LIVFVVQVHERLALRIVPKPDREPELPNLKSLEIQFQNYDFLAEGAWHAFDWKCKHKLPLSRLSNPNAFPYNGKYNKIYYQHSRKAAGTTLAFWLACVAKYHNMTFETDEDWSFQRYRLDKEPNTFFVTSLREPISRILSSYKYEGRWKITDRERTTATAKSFMDWMRETEERSHDNAFCKAPACDGEKEECFRCNLHACNSNYYSKLFGSKSESKRPWILTDDNVREAKINMLRFNKVVEVEKLPQPSYLQQLQELFNAEIEITRTKSWFAEGQHPEPYEIIDENLKYLQDLNTLDSRLYGEMVQALSTDSH